MPMPLWLSTCGKPSPWVVWVLHTNGCCCGPEKIGPVTGWFTTVKVAVGRPWPRPFESAKRVFSPRRRPSTMPVSVRADSSSSSVAVTSSPLTSSFALCSGTFWGIDTCTSASPPVTMIAGLESTSISNS
jgi:hypothetical protein